MVKLKSQVPELWSSRCCRRQTMSTLCYRRLAMSTLYCRRLSISVVEEADQDVKLWSPDKLQGTHGTLIWAPELTNFRQSATLRPPITGDGTDKIVAKAQMVLHSCEMSTGGKNIGWIFLYKWGRWIKFLFSSSTIIQKDEIKTRFNYPHQNNYWCVFYDLCPEHSGICGPKT